MKEYKFIIYDRGYDLEAEASFSMPAELYDRLKEVVTEFSKERRGSK